MKLAFPKARKHKSLPIPPSTPPSHKGMKSPPSSADRDAARLLESLHTQTMAYPAMGFPVYDLVEDSKPENGSSLETEESGAASAALTPSQRLRVDLTTALSVVRQAFKEGYQFNAEFVICAVENLLSDVHNGRFPLELDVKTRTASTKRVREVVDGLELFARRHKSLF